MHPRFHQPINDPEVVVRPNTPFYRNYLTTETEPETAVRRSLMMNGALALLMALCLAVVTPVLMQTLPFTIGVIVAVSVGFYLWATGQRNAIARGGTFLLVFVAAGALTGVNTPIWRCLVFLPLATLELVWLAVQILDCFGESRFLSALLTTMEQLAYHYIWLNGGAAGLRKYLIDRWHGDAATVDSFLEKQRLKIERFCEVIARRSKYPYLAVGLACLVYVVVMLPAGQDTQMVAPWAVIASVLAVWLAGALSATGFPPQPSELRAYVSSFIHGITPWFVESPPVVKGPVWIPRAGDLGCRINATTVVVSTAGALLMIIGYFFCLFPSMHGVWVDLWSLPSEEMTRNLGVLELNEKLNNMPPYWMWANLAAVKELVPGAFLAFLFAVLSCLLVPAAFSTGIMFCILAGPMRFIDEEFPGPTAGGVFQPDDWTPPELAPEFAPTEQQQESQMLED